MKSSLVLGRACNEVIKLEFMNASEPHQTIVIPAQAGIPSYFKQNGMPAVAGMTPVIVARCVLRLPEIAA